MNFNTVKISILVYLILIMSSSSLVEAREKWSIEKAEKWYAEQPWLVGCNFSPSTAINQLEMWQENTFDPETIDRELGYAEDLGFNTVRVYLHYLVWARNSEKFKRRIEQYLTIAENHQIKTMFVLFDDCWNGYPNLGKQPEPKPGLHNSGWVQCPGQEQVTQVALFPVFRAYTKDIVASFRNDKRILLWDLYNEPGNSNHKAETLPLLKGAFQWALEENPTQPVSAGVWGFYKDRPLLNKFQVENSDIITFHVYDTVEDSKIIIEKLKENKRPMICTEYMRRDVNTFENQMPIFVEENIGCINWGLVSGKTQTIYPWDSWEKPYDKEPEIWFHDIFRKDGTPYSKKEVKFIKKMIKKTGK